MGRERKDIRLETVVLGEPEPGQEHEFAELRARAMRPSLEAIGRFDETRVRNRLLEGYDRASTWAIRRGEVLVGFCTFLRREEDWFLSHLYVEPALQGSGIGSEVLRHLLSGSGNLDVRLNALVGSPSNGFYRSHGFELERTEEFDNHYVRRRNSSGGAGDLSPSARAEEG